MPDEQKSQDEIEKAIEYVKEELDEGETPDRVISDLESQGWPHDDVQQLVTAVVDQRRNEEAAEERFPNMTPVNSAPSMFTLNGFGVGVYGSRDHDAETGTFVKTHCVSAIFIPLFCLGAYRVLKDPGGSGWYFIGKEPLSRFARFWNWFLVLGILSLVGMGYWQAHKANPEYIAERKLEQAGKLVEEGQLPQAARLYEAVATGLTSHSGAGRESLNELLQSDAYAEAEVKDQTQILGAAARTHRSKGGLEVAYDLSVPIVEDLASRDPVAASHAWGVVADIKPDRALELIQDLFRHQFQNLEPEMTCRVYETAFSAIHKAQLTTGLSAMGMQSAGPMITVDPESATRLLTIVLDHTRDDKFFGELEELVTQQIGSLNAEQAESILRVAWDLSAIDRRDWVVKLGVQWLAEHEETPAARSLKIVNLFKSHPDPESHGLQSLRRDLLETVVSESPGELNYRIELADLLNDEGELDRVHELLIGFRDQLGDGEGARLLGQALAERGEFDESYELLEPYVETRLSALHEAEKQLDDAIDRAQNQAVRYLETGKAPGFRYGLYESANESRKEQLVNEFLVREIQGNTSVTAARIEMTSRSGIVSVALDLGIVTLRRAQGLPDPAERQTELEKAENTFLAVQGVAGDSDRYRIYLGQVYYWLGKQDEGHKVFEELLDSQERSHESLMAVANVLYEIGVEEEVRSLAEEAYESAATDEERHASAQVRSLSSIDIEDRVEWLNKSDLGLVSVQAELETSRGYLAAGDGDDEKAVAHYRKAIGLYEQMPETSAAFNNGALVFLALYNVTGDREALKNGTRWLEESVKLDPSEGIGLSNLATNLVRLGLSELSGDGVDLRELEMSGDLRALNALAADSAQLNRVRKSAAENDNIDRAIKHFEKVVVLSPKRLAAYGFLTAIHSFTHDADGLQQVSERFADAQPDMQATINETMLTYVGPEAPDDIKRWTQLLEEAQQRVADYSKAGQPVALALAVDALVNHSSRAVGRNAEHDHDALVKLAEGTHAETLSLTTYRSLIRACLFRAVSELSKQSPEFAELSDQCLRSVGVNYLIAAAMMLEGDAGEDVRAHADVKRAVGIIAELVQKFPDMCTEWDWAMLNLAGHDQAARAKEFVATDRFLKYQRYNGLLMSPINAAGAMNVYWAEQAGSEGEGSAALLKRLGELGVPIPSTIPEQR